MELDNVTSLFQTPQLLEDAYSLECLHLALNA
jgi:hypothetical protein